MLVRLARTTLSRQLTTSATSKRHRGPLTLSFVIAGTRGHTETETYASAKYFRNAFQGYRFTNPKTGNTFVAADLPKHYTDSSVVYIAEHPFFTARRHPSLDGYSHNEVTDKAFENRACRALEHHLQLRSVWRRDNPKRTDGWRILTGDDGKDIAEWVGIWESPNGQVYFLEGKHLLDFVSSTSFMVLPLFIFISSQNY
jgi:hypothetical protein